MSALQLLRWSVWLAIGAPVTSALLLGVSAWLRETAPSERSVARGIGLGLLCSLLANGAVSLLVGAALGEGAGGTLAGGLELDFGSWLTSGSYEIPLVLLVDRLGLAFALLASLLTFVVATFSRTYLHRESGYLRFFFMVGVFASGTQFVAYAGAFDLMFAGWEMIGIASTLFIGFFHQRAEPLRSSVWALSTYRLCDAGFLLAVVAVHEWLGSTRLSALPGVSGLSTPQATIIATLFLLSSLGKSAQLPFSGWLARAMEGPTPSSALFYGGVSIHVGLFLLLRVWSVIAHSPAVEIGGVAIGLLTAFYANSVARVQPDAKGALAHATLSQVGLIFAEIAAGWTTLALAHLVCHALLRVWQYLRAPNALHDSHRLGHGRDHGRGHGIRSGLALRLPALHRRLYAGALSRWRVEESLEAGVAPFLRLGRWLEGLEHRYREKERP